MKTLILIPKSMALALGVVTFLSFIAIPGPVLAQSKGAAAAALTKHTQVGAGQSVAVKAEASSARACSKCQVSQVKVAERPTKTGAATEWKLITRNACPECENELATAGTGKLAKTTLAKSCELCCKMDPECCVKNPICCVMNSAVEWVRPTVMARN